MSDKDNKGYDSLRAMLDKSLKDLLGVAKQVESEALEEENRLYARLLLENRTPLVGLIVNYHLVPGTGSIANSHWQLTDMCPAIITRVWSNNVVDITVYPDFSRPFQVTTVHAKKPNDPIMGRVWSWPEAPRR